MTGKLSFGQGGKVNKLKEEKNTRKKDRKN